MRRSLAPSQVGGCLDKQTVLVGGGTSIGGEGEGPGGSSSSPLVQHRPPPFKRAKFVPPFLASRPPPAAAAANTTNGAEAHAGSHFCTSTGASTKPTVKKSSKDDTEVRSNASILAMLEKPGVEGSGNSDLKAPCTAVKKPSFQCPSVLQPHDENATIEPELARYFSVVWCKLSKRKHKKWEGDAVLVIKGRSAILHDMEGKEIGKASGYKSTEVEKMEDGQTLIIGGKEVEIMGPISAENFKSGKCFQQCATLLEAPEPSELKPKPTRPYICPSTNSSFSKKSQFLRDKPLFNNSAPDAFVMPQPPPFHQFQNNNADFPIVDVVVDPYLSSKLRPHQREGIVFLYECIMGFRMNGQVHGAILADEMGLGKTLQCIALIWTLLKQGPYGGKPALSKIVIITPSSLAKNWMQEFDKWLGKHRITAFVVDQSNKPADLKKYPLTEVAIVSYDMFIRYPEDIDKFKPDLVVCDEGHRLKNINAKTSTLLSKLKCIRRILLTGTPIQNDLQEFHSIVEFVNPGILGTPAAFRRIYEEPIVASQQPNVSREEKELGDKRAADLSHKTGLFILRRTQDVINKYLPPKTESVVFCQTSDKQAELYRALLDSHFTRECFSMAGDSCMQYVLPIIAMLKKICNHPDLAFRKANEEEDTFHDVFSKLNHSEGLEYFENHSGKLAVLVKILAHLKENSNERIVLVSHYTQTLNMLAEVCKRYGYAYLRLDGSTSTSQRMALVDRFNNKYCNDFVFLLSSKAGGVGLNLIGASRILLYDIDWNPANDLQAMSRVWRDGQRVPVHIYRLISAGTIEEKIYIRQLSKQRLTGALADLKDTAKVRFSRDELKDLFTLHTDVDCLTHQLMNCTCLDEDEECIVGEEEVKSDRDCQLGRSEVQKVARNLSMDELMEWKHIPAPVREDLVQDPSLTSAVEYITFVFQSTTTTTLVS